MEVDPQAVINALSQQIGALQTENTVLKMALNETTQQLSLLRSEVAKAVPVEEDEETDQRQGV